MAEETGSSFDPIPRSKNNGLEKDRLWKDKRVIRKCWALITNFQ